MEKGVEAAMQEQLSALSGNVSVCETRVQKAVVLSGCATGVFACVCLCR